MLEILKLIIGLFRFLLFIWFTETRFCVQDHLGDVVYVELPDVGNSVTQGKSFGAVESVKATSDINSPVSGEVIDVNTELNGSPGLVSVTEKKLA